MKSAKVLFLCFLSFLSMASTADIPCTFASSCTCIGQFDGWHVDCANVTDNSFRNLFKTQSTQPIGAINIEGDFTEIPDDAFSKLGADIGELHFQRTKPYERIGLNFSSKSFSQQSGLTIKSISFVNFLGLKTLPQKTFSGANGLDILSVSYSGIQMIANDTFVGVNLTRLEFKENEDLRHIDTDAFNGLEDSLQYLYLTRNNLEEVPEDIKNLNKLERIFLDYNNLTEIREDAFPHSINVIVLSDNHDLSTIHVNAFQNLTNLAKINVDNCALTEVPHFGEVLLPYLFEMSVTNNKIQRIKNRDFPEEVYAKMENMPKFDNNPIEEIQENAFDGLIEVVVAEFNNLYELKTLNFSVFSKMEQLITVGIQDSRKLENLIIDDPSTLPPRLTQIGVANALRIAHFDPNFGRWLDSSEKLIDLAYNGFVCDDQLRWMNEYMFCSFYPQIYTKYTNCDDTKVPLKDYLKNFELNCH